MGMIYMVARVHLALIDRLGTRKPSHARRMGAESVIRKPKNAQIYTQQDDLRDHSTAEKESATQLHGGHDTAGESIAVPAVPAAVPAAGYVSGMAYGCDCDYDYDYGHDHGHGDLALLGDFVHALGVVVDVAYRTGAIVVAVVGCAVLVFDGDSAQYHSEDQRFGHKVLCAAPSPPSFGSTLWRSTVAVAVAVAEAAVAVVAVTFPQVEVGVVRCLAVVPDLDLDLDLDLEALNEGMDQRGAALATYGCPSVDIPALEDDLEDGLEDGLGCGLLMSTWL